MVNLEDFSKEYEEAREAAQEYVRRAEKGIPSDRWVDGRVGMVALARANRTLLRMIDLQTQVIEAMHDAALDRSREAMEPHRDPCRE